MSKIVNTYVQEWHHAGKPDSRTKPMFVLTKGDDNLYACYAGLVDLPPAISGNEATYEEVRQEAALRIQANGMKMTYNMMDGFFNGIRREQYRA